MLSCFMAELNVIAFWPGHDMGGQGDTDGDIQTSISSVRFGGDAGGRSNQRTVS